MVVFANDTINSISVPSLSFSKRKIKCRANKTKGKATQPTRKYAKRYDPMNAKEDTLGLSSSP